MEQSILAKKHALSMSRRLQIWELHFRGLSLCRRSIVEKLRSGESVLDALKRLGSPDVPGSSQEGGSSSKAGRLADMRSRLAGTVPTENRCDLRLKK